MVGQDASASQVRQDRATTTPVPRRARAPAWPARRDPVRTTARARVSAREAAQRAVVPRVRRDRATYSLPERPDARAAARPDARPVPPDAESVMRQVVRCA